MGHIKSVSVCGVSYNIAQASAVEQKKLLSMLGANLAMKISVTGNDEVDAKFLAGHLMSIDESDLDTIAGIVLAKATKHGDSKVVDIKDFQGSVWSYFMLVAEGVKANLDDFFTFILSEQQKSAEVENQASQ